MKNFQDLLVWHKSHALTLQSYQNTGDFPRHELFGLTSQIRRCTASIPANIAEACGRRAAGEFDRFLQIAAGSASELQYHFLLARDLCDGLPGAGRASPGGEANARVADP